MNQLLSITKSQHDDGPTCTAPNKSGKPCRGRPRESGFCFAHDPSTKDERKAARVKGGKNSSRAARLEKLMPSRLRPTFELLETAIKDVFAGRLDPRQASAMASLAGAMVKVIKAGEDEASTEIPPQFIMNNLEKFYADIRAIQQGMPRGSGEGGEETVEELKARMKAFGDKFARDIIEPTESL